MGAAVRCASGRVYTDVNLEACGYGPCAEPFAIGIAISCGEREIPSIVSVVGTAKTDRFASYHRAGIVAGSFSTSHRTRWWYLAGYLAW